MSYDYSATNNEGLVRILYTDINRGLKDLEAKKGNEEKIRQRIIEHVNTLRNLFEKNADVQKQLDTFNRAVQFLSIEDARREFKKLDQLAVKVLKSVSKPSQEARKVQLYNEIDKYFELFEVHKDSLPEAEIKSMLEDLHAKVNELKGLIPSKELEDLGKTLRDAKAITFEKLPTLLSSFAGVWERIPELKEFRELNKELFPEALFDAFETEFPEESPTKPEEVIPQKMVITPTQATLLQKLLNLYEQTERDTSMVDTKLRDSALSDLVSQINLVVEEVRKEDSNLVKGINIKENKLTKTQIGELRHLTGLMKGKVTSDNLEMLVTGKTLQSFVELKPELEVVFYNLRSDIAIIRPDHFARNYNADRDRLTALRERVKININTMKSLLPPSSQELFGKFETKITKLLVDPTPGKKADTVNLWDELASSLGFLKPLSNQLDKIDSTLEFFQTMSKSKIKEDIEALSAAKEQFYLDLIVLKSLVHDRDSETRIQRLIGQQKKNKPFTARELQGIQSALKEVRNSALPEYITTADTTITEEEIKYTQETDTAIAEEETKVEQESIILSREDEAELNELREENLNMRNLINEIYDILQSYTATNAKSFNTSLYLKLTQFRALTSDNALKRDIDDILINLHINEGLRRDQWDSIDRLVKAIAAKWESS